MSSISKIWTKLQVKEYRDGFTEAQLSIEIPFQIRALREKRKWTQSDLSALCGIPQQRISHIEQPGRDPLSLRTLYRLASAFDVGLLVSFAPFSELVARDVRFDPKTFSIPSFPEDDSKSLSTSGDVLLTTSSVVPTTEPELLLLPTVPPEVFINVSPLATTAAETLQGIGIGTLGALSDHGGPPNVWIEQRHNTERIQHASKV